jgi:uncharacterized protein
MKGKIILVFLISCYCFLNAQVTITPAPQPGFEKRIRSFIDTMQVVDTHEHLTGPTGITKSGMFDFMLLFHHYADDDIKSAGMSKPTFETLLKDSLSVLQKWEIMKPYWEGSFNTAYNRNVLLTADKLFGIKKIDATTVAELSDKIRKAYAGDWYKTILKDKCRIDFLILDGTDRSFGDPGMFRYTKKFDYFQFDSKKKIDQVAGKQGVTVQSADDLTKALTIEFEKALKEGFATIKNSTAYFRSLYFEDVPRDKAEDVLKMILNAPDKVFPFEAIKPLSDYMMHRVLDLARKYNTPVQIHTGLQAGDGNYIENSNPALLANLFLKYRDVRFILFHGGYPFGGEFGTLAKNFRNVYIDLCWLYIISPSYTERYLNDWLETVPANKIMAFGGDFENVEGVYGHLLLAREVVANVLIEKVRKRYFTEEEALKIARMILHDNAVNLFRLKH